VIITFLGTKGGTGTTTMAVNCATTIRRISNQPTLLVEAKPGPGDLAVFLALRPRHSLLELLDQRGWTHRDRLRRFVCEHDSGLHVLVAGEAFGRPNDGDQDAFDQVLAHVRGMYGYVVIDAGSTLTSSAVTALGTTDMVMLVANPDVPCLRNVRRLSDALRVAGVVPERIRILLNRASDQGVMPVPQLESVLGRAIDFQVGSDYRTVASALNSGVPIAALRPTILQHQIESLARTVIGPAGVLTAS
jgi:pilus assembly protein CpaE